MKITTKKTKTRAAKIGCHESVIDLEEQIRRRAYELYERRGREDGQEIADWLQAEAELARDRTVPIAAETVETKRNPLVVKNRKGKANQVRQVESVGGN